MVDIKLVSRIADDIASRQQHRPIVVCDNTERYRTEYADYLAFLEDPAHRFRTMTLPFDGGLELSVRVP